MRRLEDDYCEKGSARWNELFGEPPIADDFNYEQAELYGLKNGPYKIKIYDDDGNSTKWLTLDNNTFHKICDALIEQGVNNASQRKGLE